MRLLLYSSLLVAQAGSILAATAAQWQNRIIYQLLTDRFARSDGDTTTACSVTDRAYCGGTWQGIINKLDYIQNMGFTAIWISPVTSQTPINGSPTGVSPDGASYHGYWQNDLYALNPNYGTADDLKALASAVHKRGMYLMVDVVANHFGWPGSSDSVDYSSFNPFNSESYFHSYCQITQDDYNNKNETAINDCWLGDSNYELVDVDTDSDDVQNAYNSWITELVSNYSIDGLRIDTVQNVQQSFWPGFNKAAGVYCVGEVDNGDPNYVCPYQNYLDGVLNYPLFYPLTRAFQSTSGSISALADMVHTLQSTCKNTTLLGSFLENHDNPRCMMPSSIHFSILLS
jgi:alpha-amylase